MPPGPPLWSLSQASLSSRCNDCLKVAQPAWVFLPNKLTEGRILCCWLSCFSLFKVNVWRRSVCQLLSYLLFAATWLLSVPQEVPIAGQILAKHLHSTTVVYVNVLVSPGKVWAPSVAVVLFFFLTQGIVINTLVFLFLFLNWDIGYILLSSTFNIEKKKSNSHWKIRNFFYSLRNGSIPWRAEWWFRPKLIPYTVAVNNVRGISGSLCMSIVISCRCPVTFSLCSVRHCIFTFTFLFTHPQGMDQSYNVAGVLKDRTRWSWCLWNGSKVSTSCTTVFSTSLEQKPIFAPGFTFGRMPQRWRHTQLAVAGRALQSWLAHSPARLLHHSKLELASCMGAFCFSVLAPRCAPCVILPPVCCNKAADRKSVV